MKKVQIPDCAHPFVVYLNGKKYIYPGGVEQEVPDEIAHIIETHANFHKPKYTITPSDGNTGSSGGGVVVCTATEPSKDTTIFDFKGLNVSFPNATIIGDGAFDRCASLSSIDLPNATSIGVEAFYYCTALSSVNLPRATAIGNYAFYSCFTLSNIDLPAATSIGKAAFCNCPALTSIDLPNATTIGNYAFQECTALSSVELPNATSIDEGAFYNCPNFETLILSNTKSVCDINILAVAGTKIATNEGVPTGEGFIYVPTKFYDNYVANFVEQILAFGFDDATAQYIATAVLRKIEDYPEICG